MPPAGLEPTILADMRPQTYALDRAATGTGRQMLRLSNKTDRCDKAVNGNDKYIHKEIYS